MKMLVVFHTPVNEGYAMATLEKTFFEVALDICGSAQNIYFAFSHYKGERVRSLPSNFTNVFEIDAQKLETVEYYKNVEDTIKSIGFDLALCFDLSLSSKTLKVLNDGQVKSVVSYWGASMSDINYGVRLLAKRIEVFFRKIKPNLFIFESESMRYHAVNGRGIPNKITTVVNLGVDTEVFKPSKSKRDFYLNELGIKKEQKVAIYTGHMESRKGVHVLMDAMISLVESGNSAWHLIICGNRPGEEQQFLDMLDGKNALDHVTFCGYRSDLDMLLPSCDVGIIASTGWDSFTMSSIEMASSGLPVIASNLQGLRESVVDGKTGYLFAPGDYKALAHILSQLGEDEDGLRELGRASRARIITEFSVDVQKKRLKSALNDLLAT
jgi:glycosyltransferase involved in cell wall biosynthesis